jgi:truncated hemoglobin YjbI
VATPQQICANRRNAQKSTGPKTPEGKQRARLNAYKHGLAAQTTVAWNDRAALGERLHDYQIELRPRGRVEADLVAFAAHAAVRLDRCARHQSAALEQALRDTHRKNEQAQHQRLSAALGRLAITPEAVVAELGTFTAGCTWMMTQLSRLRAALETTGTWTVDDAVLALRLSGTAAVPTHQSPPAQAHLWRAWLSTAAPVPPEQLDRFFGPRPEGQSDAAWRAWTAQQLPSRAEGREHLAAVVAEQLAWWTAQREWLWKEIEEPALRQALDLRLVEDSPMAALRLRYETAAVRDLHRALNQLIYLRKAGLVDPAAPNEANRVEESPEMEAVPESSVEISEAALAEEDPAAVAAQAAESTVAVAAPVVVAAADVPGEPAVAAGRPEALGGAPPQRPGRAPSDPAAPNEAIWLEPPDPRASEAEVSALIARALAAAPPGAEVWVPCGRASGWRGRRRERAPERPTPPPKPAAPQVA